MFTAAPVGAPPTATDAALDDLVHNEQARLLLERARVSTITALPTAVLVLWLLWPHLGAGLLLSWFAAKVAVAALRLHIDRRARNDLPSRQALWVGRFEWLLAADGLLFGMLGWLLLPPDLPSMTPVMVATVVAIGAVGTVVLSVNARSCLAFVLPLLLPTMALQFADGSRFSLYLGLGMNLFLLMLVIEVRKSARHTQAMLRLRFQMDQLAAERETALAQALHGDAAKSQFLATMSHEMRTPLHGILGLARELQRPGSSVAEQRQHLQTLERTGDHLLGVINDVLDYSKIGSGHLRLQPQHFELGALLASLAAFSEVAARERGLDLRLESSVDPPCWLHGDLVRLRQVLLNLLGNAVKFTDAGRVTLRARGEPAALRGGGTGLALTIEVSDTGPGVPSLERERIFDAFHQADGSYARRKGGTGLGLAISRELARAMGGDLECLAQRRVGATFRLSLVLPAGNPPPSAGRAPVAEVPTTVGGAEGLRVLLVEDNEVNAIVARAMLERAGAIVTHAADGEAAVALAQQAGIDLILMDCQMPGIDGFEATARIRRDERVAGRSRVNIVALTANALEGDRERCLAAGMDEHLSKPFAEEQLLALLTRKSSAAAPA